MRFWIGQASILNSRSFSRVLVGTDTVSMHASGFSGL